MTAEYSTRRNILARACRYRLGPHGLEWKDDRQEGRVAYEDVVEVRSHRVRLLDPFAATLTRQHRCVVRLRRGPQIVLVSTNYAGFRLVEDRLARYLPFVRELEARIRETNPTANFISRPHWSMRLGSVAGRMAALLLRIVRRIDPDRLADLCAGLMRRVGPHLAYQRTGRENLQAAFPEKSVAEIEQILLGVWDNLGRIAAELAHLDHLWDFDPKQANPGRIVLSPTSKARLLHLRDDGRPALLFGAHLANWELPALAGTTCGLDGAVVYQRPHIGPIADEILRIRKATMGALIPAGPDAPLRIADALKHGVHVGMLVDQHFTKGVDVVFFGRRCKANPMLARLARRFDCPIHGTRVVRLAGHRFCVELTEAIDAPRDGEGRIDVPGTTQLIATIIEAWVREHPEQWLWLHRRWR